ncbi:MAG: protein kinase [Chloroflexia bacterium]|nr:protein kinase [Chloroflexia bacterium]
MRLMGLYCPKCHNQQHQEQAGFCGACGARLVLRCPVCQEENRLEAKFCRQCAVPLAPLPAEQRQFCPLCGEDNSYTAKFCRHCGAAQRRLLGRGTRLQNRYRLDLLLGCGGFSAVYRAYDLSGQQFRAIKELLDTHVDISRQFRREAELLQNLRHAQLPRYYGSFEENGRHYLVMEFIAGQDLDDLMCKQKERGEFFQESMVLGWAIQLCDALHYLHSQSTPIIHRDVKPANILLTPDGALKLVDLGIAKLYNPADPTHPTTKGARAVTPGYSPLEQYGQTRTDARTDVYALGATLYTLLTHQAPPEAPDRVGQFPSMPAPRQLNPAISPELERVVLEALALHAEQRYSSMEEMKRALLGRSPTSVECPHCGVHTTYSQPKCLHCGQSLGKDAVVAFSFTPSDQASNLPALIQLCERHWSLACDNLYDGLIGMWLRESLYTPAEAKKADAAVAQYPDDRDRGLDCFLRSLNPHLAPADFAVPSLLDLGRVERGDRIRGLLSIAHHGHGLLEGSLHKEVSWLELDTQEFTLYPGERLDVSFTVDSGDLAEGTVSNPAIRVQAGSHSGTVTLQFEVGFQPCLRLSSQELDLGRLSVESDQIASGDLVAVNEGGGLLQGRVVCAVPWLCCQPAVFSLAHRQEQAIALSARARDVPVGSAHRTQVHILTPAGTPLGQVDVRLTVKKVWYNPWVRGLLWTLFLIGLSLPVLALAQAALLLLNLLWTRTLPDGPLWLWISTGSSVLLAPLSFWFLKRGLLPRLLELDRYYHPHVVMAPAYSATHCWWRLGAVMILLALLGGQTGWAANHIWAGLIPALLVGLSLDPELFLFLQRRFPSLRRKRMMRLRDGLLICGSMGLGYVVAMAWWGAYAEIWISLAAVIGAILLCLPLLNEFSRHRFLEPLWRPLHLLQRLLPPVILSGCTFMLGQALVYGHFSPLWGALQPYQEGLGLSLGAALASMTVLLATVSGGLLGMVRVGWRGRCWTQIRLCVGLLWWIALPGLLGYLLGCLFRWFWLRLDFALPLWGGLLGLSLWWIPPIRQAYLWLHRVVLNKLFSRAGSRPQSSGGAQHRSLRQRLPKFSLFPGWQPLRRLPPTDMILVGIWMTLLTLPYLTQVVLWSAVAGLLIFMAREMLSRGRTP